MKKDPEPWWGVDTSAPIVTPMGFRHGGSNTSGTHKKRHTLHRRKSRFHVIRRFPSKKTFHPTCRQVLPGRKKRVP
jgi:hypothetical protein